MSIDTTEVQNRETAKSAFFSLALVAVISIIIGFAGGYVVGFDKGVNIPITVIAPGDEDTSVNN